MISMSALNVLACAIAFWPVVASSTIQVSCGAPGIALSLTRRTFLSSSMRPAFECRRPAVSQITMS